MFRRIYLITLALTAPALHGMWCFDQPFRDAYDTYGTFIRGVQKNKKIVAQLKSIPTYNLFAFQGLNASSPLPVVLFIKRTLQKSFFQLLFCNKKQILQDLQNELVLSLLAVSGSCFAIDHKNSKMVAGIITKIILTESKHPGYQSFFHGANGGIAVLFELHKKLYAKFHDKKPVDFEFLRARGTRKDLTGITRDDYFERRKGLIHDYKEPDRTNLLSVAYVPLGMSMNMFLANSSSFPLNFERFFKDILASYNLPMPVVPLFRTHLSHGLFLHILMKRDMARYLVYNSKPFGEPKASVAIPYNTETVDLYEDQARIILDPTVFDDPSDDVKIIRYQQLSDEEQKEIDAFCDNLIAQAEKLKAEQEKERK